MLAGRAIMVNWCNVAPEYREKYYRWHTHEHMVGRMEIPGYLRARRYEAVRADRDFLNFYEVADFSVITGPAYAARANNPSELTKATSIHLREAIRALAHVRFTSGFAQGGYMLTVRLEAKPGAGDELDAFLAQQALPAALEAADITGAHLTVADKAASSVVTPERSNRPPARVPDRIVMVEGMTAEALERTAAGVLSDPVLEARGAAAIEMSSYTLQVMVSR